MSDSEDVPSEVDTRARAMDLLARRDHSSGELRDKLLDKGFPAEHVTSVIDDMTERGWIDDESFARRQSEILVRKQWGPMKIVQKLNHHGVDYDLAQRIVDELDVGWTALARERLRSKYGETFDTEKAFRHLGYRGFPASIARRAVFDD